MNKNTYKNIHSMHKYWGKKPFDVVSKFIEQYTDKNDTVLDCFCGSGVTLIESLKLQRNCIGIDINPIAIKLSKVSTTKVNVDAIENQFKEIESELKNNINSLYAVNGFITTHNIWENDKITEVWFLKDKKKQVRDGTVKDVEMANNPIKEPKWFPNEIMVENSRLNVKNGQRVSDLFTKRALVALSFLIDKIKKIKDENLRDVFEIVFSGTLSQASKMVFVINRNNRKEVGSWAVGYWIPKEHFEINVWNCFKNRYKRVLKAMEEVNQFIIDEQTITLCNESSTKMKLKDDSIDYVFIDPPHANRILYAEQSKMWNAWLELDDKINFNNEIVVSEAKSRNKDVDNYFYLMDLVFCEIQRVLKINKMFSFAFNCLDDVVWIKLLNLFKKYGFEIESVIPLEYSVTSMLQDTRKNALKTDFVLTFRNMKQNSADEIHISTDMKKLKEEIEKIKQYKDDVKTYEIINELFVKSIPNGYIYKISDIVKSV